jgi:hypothetical protein
MWLSEQLDCKEGKLEILNSGVLQLLYEFINDMRSHLLSNNDIQTSDYPEGESLIEIVGNMVRLLTRKGFSIRKITEFSSKNLFTGLLVEHFIETPSMKKYYTGLCIVKNLLAVNAETTTNMIIEYEDSCANSFRTGD